LRLRDVGEHERTEPRTRLVPQSPVADVQQMLAGAVGGERLEPELGGELRHAQLGRADPLAAGLDDGPVGQLVVEDAAAHPVPGLEHHDLFARGHEVAGGDQTCDPGAHDDDVRFDPFRHGRQRT
jgi:hypothetical protein